jgi:Rrf2 family protein
MRYTKRTEYGLICMIYIAKNLEANWVTIKEIAAKENYPVAYIEKILQSLRHAGLVVSHQGNHGGYELARKPSEITLRQIIDALEGTTFEVFCAPEVREDIVCNHICMCGAKPIWRKTKDLLDHFYDSITLETLAKPQAEVQNLLVTR